MVHVAPATTFARSPTSSLVAHNRITCPPHARHCEDCISDGCPARCGQMLNLLTLRPILAGMAKPPDVIVAANDDMALGALEALKARNLLGKVKLIGFDALPEALGQIKAGNLTATIEQLPGGQVRGALQALVAFLRDGKKPDQQVTLLTPIAITSDNLNEAERLNEVK